MSVVQVWERLVVTVDAVLLLDAESGTVQWHWQSTAPKLRLYDELVLAGVPLVADSNRAWSIGRSDWIELLMAATDDQVLMLDATGTTTPLANGLADLVLDVYRRRIDDDAT
jgi:hypothetical protein